MPSPFKILQFPIPSHPQILCGCKRFIRLLRASPVHDDDKSPPSSSSSSSTTTTTATTSDNDDSTLKQQQEAAREAVSEILQEFGASKEESVDIVLRSPKYLAMLLDSVRDLDDISLWNPWTRKRKKEQSIVIVIGCQRQQQLRPEEEEEDPQQQQLFWLQAGVYKLSILK